MKKAVCVIFLWAMTWSSFSEDWPQFCGPTRNNVSTETGLADDWSVSGPRILWEMKVHKGYASPAIKDGKVYLIDREGDNSLFRCLDLLTGKELWRIAFPDPGQMDGRKYEGTRGTPTLVDDAAYLVTGYGVFVCVDLTSRTVRWRHDLMREFGAPLPKYGFSQNPCVSDSMVYVAPNSEHAGVAAYDRSSGKLVWTSMRLGQFGYVSPLVVTLCGEKMVVAIGSNQAARKSRSRSSKDGARPSIPGHVLGLSAQDGSVLWDYQGWKCRVTVPHPVPLSGDRLFITGGYLAGSAEIRIVKTGETFSIEEVAKTKKVGPQVHQPILVGNNLFIVNNSDRRNDGLVCWSLDDELRWRTKDVEDAPNFARGGFIFADGKLIMLDGKSGILYLVKPDPSGYKQLAAAKVVEKNEMAWAPLALSDGKLIVRDWNTLKCVDLK